MGTFTDRLKSAINVFIMGDDRKRDYGIVYASRPDRPRMTKGNQKSLMSSVYNRIAIDVASIPVNHVQLDSDGRFLEILDTHLNDCLTRSANIDQTGRAFLHDAVLSMFDEGVVAIVPTDISKNYKVTSSYDIYSLRTGKIIEWMPKHVKVRVYDDNDGVKKDIILPKSFVAIAENPFYTIMNEPNSIVQRLIRKMNLLDIIDEQTSSGKLDLIIQLPYTIRSEGRKRQAEERRRDIETQLVGSKYGIAYTDGTERITQLNRPIENNLMTQVQYLMDTAFSQLGISKDILDGSANSETMLNYYNRIIEPCLAALVDAMRRSFVTDTALTQGKTIWYHNDPFKLIPVDKIADIADKFTRNEILTSNEIRSLMGFKPSSDKRADQLLNKNLNHPDEGQNGEEHIKQIENGDDI